MIRLRASCVMTLDYEIPLDDYGVATAEEAAAIDLDSLVNNDAMWLLTDGEMTDVKVEVRP